MPHRTLLFALNKVQATSLSALDAKSSNSNNSSRKKNNKYAQFSKQTTQLDPMDRMLLESRSKLEELSKEKSKKDKNLAAVEDSLEAVDELLSSMSVNVDLDREVDAANNDKPQWERNQRQFPDNKSIDPYDPTTYGYIELGAWC